MERIAIYYRVSTDKQDLESQRIEIERWLETINPKPKKISVIEDLAFSGKRKDRPGYIKMMKMAEKKSIDTIVVYRLDRFSRDANTAIRTILELDTLGIAFISVTQPVLNLGHNMPFRKTILAAFAEIAELERDAIVARVKSGLAAARKRGVKLGAPIKVTPEKRERIWELRRGGLPFAAIAIEVGLSLGAIHKAYYERLNIEKNQPVVVDMSDNTI